jgi:hypothetical protein
MGCGIILNFSENAVSKRASTASFISKYNLRNMKTESSSIYGSFSSLSYTWSISIKKFL